MGRDVRQEALKKLLERADLQGYITFDNIMDCADAHSLPIQDFDWLTSTISTRGIIVYDEDPTKRTVLEQDDDGFDDYAQCDYEAVYSRIVEMDDSLRNFVSDVRNIVPPQRREFDTIKYQVREGNQHARERMIEMHLRIALRMALQRAEMFDMEIQEAVGEACVGLVIAVDKYNPDLNGPFGSYAAMWILQNLSRRQPTQRSLVYYPVHKKECYYSFYSLLKNKNLIDEDGFVDDEFLREIVKTTLSFSDEQINEVVMMSTPLESLEEMIDRMLDVETDRKKNEIERYQIHMSKAFQIVDVEQVIEERSLREIIGEMILTLSDREALALIMRFGLDGENEKTLDQIGKTCSITRERARQIINKALTKLRLPSNRRQLLDYYV